MLWLYHCTRARVQAEGYMQERLLLRIDEAARRLGLSRTTVYDEIRRGRLRVVHIGRAARVPAAELERYVARLTMDPPVERHV
jgi:excisionase family DNA binding protein